MGYKVHFVIGDGRTALVSEVTTADNTTYAMKVMEMKEYRLTPSMAREVSILFDINHENIVRLEEVVSCGNSLHLIMEHAGEDLNAFLMIKGVQNSEITKARSKLNFFYDISISIWQSIDLTCLVYYIYVEMAQRTPISCGLPSQKRSHTSGPEARKHNDWV